ncbi:membrane-bound serine protease [Paenibacillus sp. TCA20]|nr:membrane-bound serine protease [Paenibacillus sp. TCA20]
MAVTLKKWNFSVVMMAVVLLAMFSALFLAPTAQAAKSGAVYVIPVDQPIERGLHKFMERGFKEAGEMEAGLIVLQINTPGGLVQTTKEIGDMIQSSSIPVAAFIHGDAASAGSYIALTADHIAMSPGSTIGAAALVDASNNYIEDPKAVATWKANMQAAAEKNDRNGEIAQGMTDLNMVVEMPEINKTKQQGQVISLTANEALKVGYADKIASTPAEVAAWLEYSSDNLFVMEQTTFEKISTFLTHPVVSTILLFLGIAGILIELFVPGFGVPGIVGVISFALYFGGSYVAGIGGSETWFLFIIGLALLIAELFVPSFGILGILGSVSLIAGVVRAAYDTGTALFSLGIAAAAAIAVVIIVAIIFKERGIWNRFILRDSMTAEQGYSSIRTREDLIGKNGISLTTLRPAGTAVIDGENVDVVTEGSFIAANEQITVHKVEGTRVVVKRINL